MKKHTRRGFLAGSGALVTGGLLAGERGAEAQQQRAAAQSVKRVIDVHHHFLPPLYTKIAQDQGAQTTPWTPAFLSSNHLRRELFASGAIRPARIW